MVDVTFPFMMLFGGALTGWIASLVLRHGRGARAADILIAGVSGFALGSAAVGTPFLGWIAATYPAYAALTSDLLFASPLIGALLGLAMLALYRRYVLGQRRSVSWLARIGEGLMIVGGVGAAVGASLIGLFVILFFALKDHGLESIPFAAMLPQLLPGLAVLALGYLLRRTAPHLRSQ